VSETIFTSGERHVFGNEGSQAVLTCSSNKGRLKRRHSEVGKEKRGEFEHTMTYWIFLGNMAYAPRSVSIVT
jgi:hypothetical protein